MQKTNLIIVGGGITGLYAAWKLAGKFNIILLEAQDRFGGRIYSISTNRGIIEAGAEFVHGKAECTTELLKTAGIQTIPVAGTFLQSKNGQWVEEHDSHPGLWGDMLEQLATAGKDETLGDFLNKYFGADSQKDLRNRVRAYAEGFDAADPDKASAQELYKEWSQQDDESRRVDGGYAGLINFLLDELKGKAGLRMKSPVTELKLSNAGISVLLANGEQLAAEKILITIPVSLLADQQHHSTIRLPVDMNTYRYAAENIGFGAVIKVIIECSEKFWPEDLGFIISNETFPTWWTQLPSGQPVITGWAGGPKAAKMKNATEGMLKSFALQSLSAIFGLPVAEIEHKTEHVHVYNWFNQPMTHGAYSYAYPQSAEARKVLRRNFQEKIWFSGEALYDGPNPGTVEAALVSAEDAVRDILTSI